MIIFNAVMHEFERELSSYETLKRPASGKPPSTLD